MEKFAVDLDKVLDELEFDEDQAENAISGGKFLVPSNNQVVNPLYHMPAFDPMTGSSSLTAPPPCTSSLSTNGQYRLGSGGTFSWRQDSTSQKKSVSGVFSSLNDYINSSENVPSSVIVSQDDDDDDDEPWEPPSRPITTDDKKPDIVGSSAADFSLGDNIEISLPDVAAGAPAPATDHITTAFDLINHQNNSDSVTCDISTSEPLANTPTSSEEQTDSEKNTNVIRFGMTEDLSDSELQQYLEELEAQEEDMLKASLGQSEHTEGKAEPWYCQEDCGGIGVEPVSCSEEAENEQNLVKELVSLEPQEELVSSATNGEEEVSSGVPEEVVSSATTVEVISSNRTEENESCDREECVSSATEESVCRQREEAVSSDPQEESVSSTANREEEVFSEIHKEPEITPSDLVSWEDKPVDETELSGMVQEVAPDASSAAEPQQSSAVEPVLETREDRVNDEEIWRSTEEESVPVEVLADSTETQMETALEQPVSSKVCEADSTGYPQQWVVKERTSSHEDDVQNPVSNPEPSQLSDESVDDKPARPSTLELPTGPAGDGVSSSEEALPYSEPGPAGATPIATRPPPFESSGPGESPLQSPDQSEDTSSLASGCEAHSEAAGSGDASETPLTPEERRLGKTAPVWIADELAATCMLCGLRFTVIRRRHHCRACGRVLCSKCGSARAPLAFMSNAEARVCVVCHKILTKVQAAEQDEDGERSGAANNSAPLGRAPNPNNPMEYCSTVPPLQQAAGALQQPAPSVMVPVVGVLKREGSTKPRSEAKQVMFSDGIRPGGDLTELDGSAEPRLPIRRPGHLPKRVGTPSDPNFNRRIAGMALGALPTIDRVTNSYIPDSDGLPPLATKDKGKITYDKNPDSGEVMALLRDEATPPLRFAVNRNLYVIVKIVTLDCCVKRVCWCFTSDGLSCVGQDEVVIVLETRNDDCTVPKDAFLHINYIYHEAATGNTVAEMGHTLAMGHSFLGSELHAGFLYIRHTTQCVQRLILPTAPFLFGILIHRWEVPWVRIFPIRLMLRLGAEYRYYPCPLISVRERPSVYGEIGDTVIKFLADFREMAYTLPSVRGLVIHMEEKRVTVLLPRNRYDQVLRALNQSNDHVLAFAANFSEEADAHLVCMQSEGEESKYYTSAIEISYKTRKVTGASFIVFSGGLKASCGMNAKSSIKEDGFVISVTSETLDAIRAALHDMKDYRIKCGPIAPQGAPDKTADGAATATSTSDGEEVLLKWAKDDCCFNIGVKSEVDGKPLDGVPSMRVHSGIDYPGGSKIIRWTEVFLLQMDEGSGRAGDSMDISRLSGALSKATCMALVRLLDLLAAVGIYTLAVRATVHPDNVGYEAGSNGEHLSPIYMNSLDDALIPVLNKAAANSADGPTVLELVFKIMEN